MQFRYQGGYQSINQSIKVICNARNVVHKLESEARTSPSHAKKGDNLDVRS